MAENYNVLLVALSTFQKVDGKDRVTLSEYHYKGDNSRGKYYYQMEPVLEILGNTLKKSDERIDSIVMLCTEATKRSRNVYFVDENNDEKNLETSECSYFEEKAKNRMNDRGEFKEIDIDKDDPTSGIVEAVRYIRDLAKNYNVNLYVDPHGGFRGTQMSLQAILSLLGKENINIEDVYNVKFGTPCEVSSHAPEFRIFDFVSGINEFINYGRADSLEAYFEHEAEIPGLLPIIQKISEAIQLCSVSDFEAGLDEMEQFFNESSEDDSQQNAYFSLFYGNIKDDYRGLLNIGEHGKKRSTIDEIEWCLRKGFYQQCLTLIEARMPKVIVENHVISCENEKFDDYVNKQKQYYEDPNVYILNTLLNYWGYYMTYEEHNAGVSVEEKLCSLLEKLDKNKKSDLEKKIIGWKFHKRVVSRLKIKNRQGDAEEPEYYYISVACEKPEDFYIFMVLHRTLKYIRNKSNHALEMSSISKESDKKYISIDNVKVAIELYIEYSNKLISYAKSRENKK